MFEVHQNRERTKHYDFNYRFTLEVFSYATIKLTKAEAFSLSKYTFGRLSEELKGAVMADDAENDLLADAYFGGYL